MRREILYDIINQERKEFEFELASLDMAIAHTEKKTHPLPITYDIMLMLLDYHTFHTYCQAVRTCLLDHPIRFMDRCPL